MPYKFLAALSLLLPLAACSSEPGGHAIPYKGLHDVVGKIQRCDPNGVMVVDLKLAPVAQGTSLPQGLRMEFRLEPERVPVALDTTGHFQLPMRDGPGSDRATLWVNQPEGVVGVRLALWARPPVSTRTTYARLTESLPVMSCIVQGVQSAVVPARRSVKVVFTGKGSQSVAIGEGAMRKLYSSDPDGVVQVPFDPSLGGDTPVEISALPDQLQPDVVDAGKPVPQGTSLLK